MDTKDEYPKLVVVFPGILRWVHSQEEMDEVRLQDIRVVMWMWIVPLTLVLLWFVWAGWTSFLSPVHARDGRAGAGVLVGSVYRYAREG